MSSMMLDSIRIGELTDSVKGMLESRVCTLISCYLSLQGVNFLNYNGLTRALEAENITFLFGKKDTVRDFNVYKALS